MDLGRGTYLDNLDNLDDWILHLDILIIVLKWNKDLFILVYLDV
jgi:hypothetical protein